MTKKFFCILALLFAFAAIPASAQQPNTGGSTQCYACSSYWQPLTASPPYNRGCCFKAPNGSKNCDATASCGLSIGGVCLTFYCHCSFWGECSPIVISAG